MLHDMPTSALHGVGSRLAETLRKLGIHSVQDLLFHLPFRYVDRTRIRRFATLRFNDTALMQGRVLDTHIAYGRRRSLIVRVEDDSGQLSLRFFHFNAAQKNSFEKGRIVRLFGEVRPGPASLECIHPEYEFIDEHAEFVAPEQTLTPIYNLTEGLGQQRLRGLIAQALKLLDKHEIEELLPPESNTMFGVRSLSEAIKTLHSPPVNSDQRALINGDHPCQQRLAFEELLAHFLVKQKVRIETHQLRAPCITESPAAIEVLLSQLAFAPTAAQQRVFKEIQTDLQQSHPMMRMVQGDVGSGKTLVAAMAAANVIDRGFQVAIVAPTEILAEQHFHNFSRWLAPSGARIEWLVGKLKPKEKQAAYERLAHHEADLVIGTHALFQEQVKMAKLALVVIDEQHRFGVDQRLSMREKNVANFVPHQLTMTATPIPRTLAMTHYAELDFSIIDELPPGRTPVNTALVSQQRKNVIIERVAAACRSGRQCYWVCPLIEESETLDVANAEQTFDQIKAQLGNISTALLHGRQKPSKKEEIMTAFKRHEIDVLVATTVIEVGVDVPNASVMIIENPERLGLAQLHQLRGRVGRGSNESHCILLYGDRLSAEARDRLQTIRTISDGFAIAEKDLAMRGPGEYLGTRQAGAMLFRVADQERDAHMFEQVKAVGTHLLKSDAHASVALINRWFGERKNYALA